MRRKEFDSREVAALYRDGVSVRSIAETLGCSEGSVYRALAEEGVAVSKRADIDPEELERLYVDERMSLLAVAKRCRVAPATVRRHLAMAGIPLRSHAESLQPLGRKACPRSLPYRAYVLGFVWGDLAAERLGPTSQTVAVRGSTTKAEQLAVITALFEPFGQVTISHGTQSACVRASLDSSFAFLLDKYGNSIPRWVRGPATEAAFAAGYIDAEGSFGVYDRRGRFKLDSFDDVVHHWLSDWMDRCGIHHVTRCMGPIRAAATGPQSVRPLWRTNVNDALSLCRLVATIEPFARHQRRRETMQLVTDNVRHRLRSRDATLSS